MNNTQGDITMLAHNNNSFNLIRHLAAFLVLFSHNFALNGLNEPIVRSWDTLGFFCSGDFFLNFWLFNAQ